MVQTIAQSKQIDEGDTLPNRCSICGRTTDRYAHCLVDLDGSTWAMCSRAHCKRLRSDVKQWVEMNPDKAKWLGFYEAILQHTDPVKHREAHRRVRDRVV